MPTLTPTAAADLFRNAPDRYLDVGAGHAAYRRVGRGPDVLFIHGWPVSGATFRKLLPHMVDDITCHIIDFPSAGSSRFDTDTPMSIAQHIETVRRVLDILEFDSIAVVGHDSGGLIARYALAGDSRLRSMGLIDTELPEVGWRFRSFVAARHLPGLSAGLGCVARRTRLCRSRLVFGDAFADRSNLDDEFEEFFLRPLATIPARRDAAAELLRSFDLSDVTRLPEIHRMIDVPVQLVWGEEDVFFPLDAAQRMVATFADARLHVVKGAGLFSHEEKPEDVADALLPVLTGA